MQSMIGAWRPSRHHMDVVPSVWEFLLGGQHPLPATLRLAVAIGEKLELSLSRRLLRAMPATARLVNTYGQGDASSRLHQPFRF